MATTKLQSSSSTPKIGDLVLFVDYLGEQYSGRVISFTACPYTVIVRGNGLDTNNKYWGVPLAIDIGKILVAN